jgi:hypothetical protein
MKELSLNILDITENSIKAGAELTEIEIVEKGNLFTLTIKDNGCGMKEDFLKSVIDPFCTTRTTRKVGMGIPLLKLACEQTGGELKIVSKHKDEFPDTHGTTVTATFFKDHIDFTPLGDIVSTIKTLIQCNPDRDFTFTHLCGENEVYLSTPQMREVLGDTPLNTYEVICWIEDTLKEQYAIFGLNS